MLQLYGLMEHGKCTDSGFRKNLISEAPEELGTISSAAIKELMHKSHSLGNSLSMIIILDDGYTTLRFEWLEDLDSIDDVLDRMSVVDVKELVGMKVKIKRCTVCAMVRNANCHIAKWNTAGLFEYSDIDAIITREHFNEMVELYGTCPGMTKELRRMRDTLLEVAKRRMIDDIMSGDKKYPIRYIRISPETGNILERGYKDITLSYLGYKKIVSMPGWYDKDFDEGIHSKEDMKVSDEALSELKSKALKSGSRKSMLEEK